MDRTVQVLSTVLPVILMLGIGMLCRAKRILTRQGVDALKTVAVQIGLPAVLLSTFASAEYSPAMLAVPLIMFALCCAAFYLGKAGGKALGIQSRFLPFLTTGFEAGMLGYALFELLYGREKLADFARIDLGQVLFVFTLYKALLAREAEGKKKSPAGIVKEMALSPIIISIAAGVLLGVTGLYQAMGEGKAILDACAQIAAAPVSALILISVGYDLALRDIPWRAALQAVGLRLAVMAALGGAALLLFRALWPQAAWEKPMLLMFLLPPPYVLSVFSNDDKQRAYLSSALSVSTMVTLLGFVALAAVG